MLCSPIVAFIILLFLSFLCQVELTALQEHTPTRVGPFHYRLLTISSILFYSSPPQPACLLLIEGGNSSDRLIVLSLETSGKMKIYSLHVIIWAMCAATMAAPIREQAPIGEELTRAIEQGGDPDLAEFAFRLQSATGDSKVQIARPSPGSNTVEVKGPERVLGQGDRSCFCSGGSVCCRQGGGSEIDCGFGLCGI